MKRFGVVISLGLLAVCGRLAAEPDADSSLEALNRDAMRLAACLRALDADCVFGLTHVESLRAAGVRTPYADLEWLRDLWHPQRSAEDGAAGDGPLPGFDASECERMTRFEVMRALPPFPVGERLYAFVPYYQVNRVTGGRLERTAFLVGISDDQGDSWRFVVINGIHIQPYQVFWVFPELKGTELPPISNEISPLPERSNTRYLRTTDGGFSIIEGGAQYVLSFDVRKKIRHDVKLLIMFDDPDAPGRQFIDETVAFIRVR